MTKSYPGKFYPYSAVSSRALPPNKSLDLPALSHLARRLQPQRPRQILNAGQLKRQAAADGRSSPGAHNTSESRHSRDDAEFFCC